MKIITVTICGLLTGLSLGLFSPGVGFTEEIRGKSQVEIIAGWETYLSQEGDYTTAVYGAALPSKNSFTPYEIIVSQLYPDCDRSVIRYFVAPAAEEAVKQGNLKGLITVGEQTFNVVYDLVNDGSGVFEIKISTVEPALILAMLAAASAEISLPNLDNYKATVNLSGLPAAWDRIGPLCRAGEGIKVF